MFSEINLFYCGTLSRTTKEFKTILIHRMCASADDNWKAMNVQAAIERQDGSFKTDRQAEEK
jgi:hypothetical protein